MLKYIITLVFFVGVFEANSQRIVVKSFRKLLHVNSSSVFIPKTESVVNGCAIIRVINAKPGLTFDFGLKRHVVAQKREKGILWLWVPEGIDSVTISNKRLRAFRNYQFCLDIVKGKVYEMVLSNDNVKSNGSIQYLTKMVIIYSRPNGVNITIDDYPAGKTPFYGSLTQGIHKIRIDSKGEKKEEYKTVTKVGFFNMFLMLFNSQVKEIEQEKEIAKGIPRNVQKDPYFKGGYSALAKFFHERVRYPAKAKKMLFVGNIYASLIISETGKTSHIKILRGFGYGYDEEAIRVIESMPRWEPARYLGYKVPAPFGTYVRFDLPEKKKKSSRLETK